MKASINSLLIYFMLQLTLTAIMNVPQLGHLLHMSKETSTTQRGNGKNKSNVKKISKNVKWAGCDIGVNVGSTVSAFVSTLMNRIVLCVTSVSNFEFSVYLSYMHVNMYILYLNLWIT